MKRALIGGIATLLIGGTGFTISQADITNNFANETGMSQQEAQQYVEDTQDNLASFSEIGTQAVADGNSILDLSAQVDCKNYTYGWESYDLTCYEGIVQLVTIGKNEVALGECYKSLGMDLGGVAKATISKCIQDIDSLNGSYDLPIATRIPEKDILVEEKKTNIYNKSVLMAALQ